MTSATRPNFLSRVLDIVFGERLTPQERALAEAAAPPRALRVAFDVLHLGSFIAMVTLILSKWNLLPIVEQQIGADWFWPAFGANVLIRLGWERIKGIYARRVQAGETLKAASPE